MKSVIRYAPLCLAIMAVQAQAQSVSPAWNAYRQGQAQEQPQPPAQPHQPADQAPAEPVTASATTTSTVHQNQAADTLITTQEPAAKAPEGGFFVGAHVGNGWVYDDLKQDATFLSAGYRWQAGSVVKVGIEAVTGKLDEKAQNENIMPEVRFYSLGATARFNFGARSPVYGIARLGYWNANVKDDENDIYGAYASVGLGVDFGRHVSLNVLYTNYVFVSDYEYYTRESSSFEVNGRTYTSYYYQEHLVDRAETLTLGLEVRF